MPRTTTQATPRLEILLDGPPEQTFHPGSTITGSIVRAAPVVSSRAHLTIQLVGRSKTKIVIQRGQAGPAQYRGRYAFFDPSATTQRLLDGPVHVPADGSSRAWAFSVTVPAGLDPAAAAAGNSQKMSYLSLARQDVGRMVLPPVYATRGMGGVLYAMSWEGFVEYFLCAKLAFEPLSGRQTVDEAKVLLNFWTPPSPEQLVRAANLRQEHIFCRVATYRLVEGDLSSLSLQQRAQELFHSSSVPTFAFSLQVEHPTVLQIGSPEPIPFRIMVLPDRDQTSNSIRDTAPTVTLTGIAFEITARTDLLCAGTLGPHSAEQKRRFDFADVPAALAAQPAPLVVPSSSSSSDTTPLDLGPLLGLAMASAPAVRAGVLSSRRVRLCPSFATFNIRHTHKLKWELKLTVAGGSAAVARSVPVTLLPGAAGGGLPPYEQFDDGDGNEGVLEAPPPFGQGEQNVDVTEKGADRDLKTP
jgi:hypothetical protein